MKFAPMKELLQLAEEKGIAYGAFVTVSYDSALAAIEAGSELNVPVIFITGTDCCDLMGGFEGTVETVKRAAANTLVPIALHLDHCRTYEECVAAINAGYSSVMIDGSSLPLDQNIELTREVVKYAHARGVSVEGELGVLGGQEDHVFAETSTYTNPLDAVEFIQKTGVDALAISYGTQHGANKGKNAKLRREIPIAIKECINRLGIFCALVSHGSSTVPQYIVKEINDLGGDIQNAYGINVDELIAAIPCGIRKINVDTDIRLAVTRNMKELFAQQPELQKSASIGGVYALLEEKKSAFDPRVFFPPIMDTILTGNVPDEDVALLMSRVEAGVKEAVGSLIVNFGSYGKAPLVEQKSLEDMIAFYKK